MNIKIKFTPHTKKRFVANILEVYSHATDVDKKHLWYVEANEFALSLSNQYQISLYKVVGVIAALSPLKSWNENKRIAKTFLSLGEAYHTTLCEGKAQRIKLANTEIEVANILRGKKITSFFFNILYPDKNIHVTIDRHAIEIAMQGHSIKRGGNITISSKQYVFIEKAYKRAAKLTNTNALDLQAITWVVRRKALQNKGQMSLQI